MPRTPRSPGPRRDVRAASRAAAGQPRRPPSPGVGVARARRTRSPSRPSRRTRARTSGRRPRACSSGFPARATASSSAVSVRAPGAGPRLGGRRRAGARARGRRRRHGGRRSRSCWSQPETRRSSTRSSRRATRRWRATRSTAGRRSRRAGRSRRLSRGARQARHAARRRGVPGGLRGAAVRGARPRWVDMARLSKDLGDARRSRPRPRSTSASTGFPRGLGRGRRRAPHAGHAYTRRRRHALRARALRPRPGGRRRRALVRRHAVHLDRVQGERRPRQGLEPSREASPASRSTGSWTRSPARACSTSEVAGKVPEVTLVLRAARAGKTWDTLEPARADAGAGIRRRRSRCDTENGLEVRRVALDQA